MSDPRPPAPAGTARRDVLRLLVLAPAAVACAGVQHAPAPAPPSTAAAQAEAAAEAALRAVREFPLALGVEPAFVFGALRTGGR
jgi:hypothetical protein